MKRTAFRAKPRPTVSRETKPKLKTCRAPGCGTKFSPQRMGQKVCGTACAMVVGRIEAEKQRAKDDLINTRARKEALKTIADRIAEAQKPFNEYIRLRDMGKGCIDCGKPFEPQKLGGSMDAGHYLSRGSASHLRFDEDNVFGQRKNCNRPGGATRAAFREGVLERIGPERLEAVESNYEVHKWTHDELIAKKTEYQAKVKQLKGK